MGTEFNEEQVKKDSEEAFNSPIEDLKDHDDDYLPFEITVINRKNEAMLLDCVSRDADVRIG